MVLVAFTAERHAPPAPPPPPARPVGPAVVLTGSHGADTGPAGPDCRPDGSHHHTDGPGRAEPVPRPVDPDRPGEEPERPATGELTGGTAPRRQATLPPARRPRGGKRPAPRDPPGTRAPCSGTRAPGAYAVGSAGWGAIGSSEASRSSHSPTSRSYASLPISSVSSGRYDTYTGSPAPCADVADVHHQCRS